MPTLTLRFHEDELLSNWLMRYSQLIGIDNQRIMQRHLLGKSLQQLCFVYDIPLQINRIIDLFQLVIPPKTILRDHTTFPFINPFLSKITQADLINSVLGEQRNVPNRLRYYLNCEYLRYCPSCVKSDMQNYGQPYWHRSHQAILLCPIHEELIVDSPFHKWPKYMATPLLYADPLLKNQYHSQATVSLSSAEHDQLDDVNKDILWLLHQSHDEISSTILVEALRFALFKHDFVGENGRLHKASDLVDKVQATFTDNLLELMGFPFSKTNTLSWPALITQKNRLKSLRPMQYLILVHSLGMDLPSLLQFAQEKGELENSLDENNEDASGAIQNKILAFREIWLAALNQHPNSNQKELRKLAGETVYQFLRGRDKQWLDNHRPHKYGQSKAPSKKQLGIYEQTKIWSNDIHLAEEIHL